MKEQRNVINKLINKLKRATTEEEKIMLYTFFHDDLLEALIEIHVLLTNLIRLENTTLKDENELIKIHYREKSKDKGYGLSELYQNQKAAYELLAGTLNDEQLDLLDNFEDSLIEWSGYEEKQAVVNSCKRTFSTIQNILKDKGL